MAGEVKDTTLESRRPGRDGVTSLCLPHLDDYTTSMSPASFFAALKIAKLSSLIAESPLPGGCPGQVSFIRDFILNTLYRMFSFSCQNHGYVDINISARDLVLRYAHIYVSDMIICVDTSDQIHLP